jgi:hypothetical protein
MKEAMASLRAQADELAAKAAADAEAAAAARAEAEEQYLTLARELAEEKKQVGGGPVDGGRSGMCCQSG